MSSEVGAFIGAVIAILLSLVVLSVIGVAVVLIRYAWMKLRGEMDDT